VLLGLAAPPLLGTVGWRPALTGLGLVVAGLLVLAARLAPGERRGRSRGGADRLPRAPLLLLWIVFAGGTAPALMLFAHAVPLALDRQLGGAVAGLAVSALAAGNLAGRLLAGWWSDRVGRLPALGLAMGTTALAVGGLAAPAPPAVVLAAFLGAGLAYGAVSSLAPAATADRVGAAAFPAAYGRVFTGWGCAGLLAPVAGAFLLRLQAEQPGALALAAMPLLPAAVALAVLSRGGSR
jgi:OFA family oxalate/formate antiporter-like MFS transporter